MTVSELVRKIQLDKQTRRYKQVYTGHVYLGEAHFTNFVNSIDPDNQFNLEMVPGSDQLSVIKVCDYYVYMVSNDPFHFKIA